VLNQEPLTKAVLLGVALGCHIQELSTFDRKSYFYPDLPMGYQITQQVHPTSIDGKVPFYVDSEYSEEREVRIRDAHIETDTAKSSHQGDAVLLDFNRAGTPLVEIVTYPDFRSDDEVIAFLKELQRVARYNMIGDADMDKGQMRCDVNISLRPV
jgi:aspartyl-tRNA(Asn)/glutamyl-tRNA(Gln) amidotransferase subunit B